MAREAQMDGGSRMNPWRIIGWGMAAGLLLLPLVAMQFTDGVDWTALDFVFAAIMFGGTGLVFELAVRMAPNAAYRSGVACALAAAFLLVWINGAVGIIGDEDNPLNLLYGGVIAVALIGAVAARFRAKGMTRAMTAAAGAQALMIVVAVIAGTDDPPGWAGLVLLNGFFVGLFALAAALFRNAAREPQPGA